MRLKGERVFWPLALMWLPAGLTATALVRFSAPGDWASWLLAIPSLAIAAPFGLPLALACRALWRQGRRRAAWTAGIGLGAVTVAAVLFAGLLGPLAIAVCAVVLSLPVWIAWWLARRS